MNCLDYSSLALLIFLLVEALHEIFRAEPVAWRVVHPSFQISRVIGLNHISHIRIIE